MSGSGSLPLQVLHLQDPGESEDGYLAPAQRRKRGPSYGDMHAHDSGVVDVDSIAADLTPPEGSTGHLNHVQRSPPGMMAMKGRPDSLAVKGHEYEDLPTARYNTYQQPPKFYYSEVNGQERPLPPPLAKLPSMNASTEKLCDGSGSGIVSPNPANNNNMYRRRQNPLYDSRSSETDSVIKGSGKRGSFLFCPYSGLMVIGFCLCVLLILIVLMLTGSVRTGPPSPFAAALVDSNVTTLEAALYKIHELENKYADVIKKKKVPTATLR